MYDLTLFDFYQFGEIITIHTMNVIQNKKVLNDSNLSFCVFRCSTNLISFFVEQSGVRSNYFDSDLEHLSIK